MTVIAITIGVVLIVGLICNTINEKMRVKSNELVRMYRIKYGKEIKEDERNNQ